MIATAPGKLILTGEYAVLDGAPALVIAVNRRVVAQRGAPAGSSPFLLAAANELRNAGFPAAAEIALEIMVDSSAFYQAGKKLGFGSSAAVTVAATALALAEWNHEPTALHRTTILKIALAAHAAAQGGRGSGADIAAAVSGGVHVFRIGSPEQVGEIDPVMLGADPTGSPAPIANLDIAASEPSALPIIDPVALRADQIATASSTTAAQTFKLRVSGRVSAMGERISLGHHSWPASVRLLPFFTGASADTTTLVSRVDAARSANRDAVDAALAAIAAASEAVCLSLRPAGGAQIIAGFTLAAKAIERLAIATGIDLVPTCVTAASRSLAVLGGMAKTTGAGGGDVGIAVIPATADESLATRILIESGCQPLPISVDDTGVDTRPGPQ